MLQEQTRKRCDDNSAGNWRHGGQMKNLCLVFGDGVRVKLYRTSGQLQTLTLVYHQVNFGGSTSDFADGLCKRLAAELRAGKFDGLVLMTSLELLTALEQSMDATCRSHLVGKLVMGARQLTEQQLLVRLKDLLASQVDQHLTFSQL
jgi:hypothetical protein